MQESLEASLVRIYTTDGRVIGAGFLVSEWHIITCAHVVAGSLGLADVRQRNRKICCLSMSPLLRCHRYRRVRDQ
jgi:hypothetical protein